MVHCPFGIDTQQIQLIAKAMLIEADMEPKPLTMKAKNAIQREEKFDQTREKFQKELEKIKESLFERWPETAKLADPIPVDKVGADYLFVSMTEKPSILPAAGILNAAGANWTLSYFEAVNFGAFLGSPTMSKQIYERITKEAERLKVKEVVICECGTAFRLLKHQVKRSFGVISLLQLMDRYIKTGKIKLDKSAVEGKITYHDPCQIARNGGIYEEPRNCLKALTDDFVELIPNRIENWCCGGGGGLVIGAEPEWRMMTSRVKADQIRASGAEIVATACEMCYAQLKDINDDFELDLRVSLVSDLVAEALVY
jgi:Fe-S oxidoreductase